MTRNRKFIVAGLALAATGLAAVGAFAHRGGPWEHHGWGHHGGLMGTDFGCPMRDVAETAPQRWPTDFLGSSAAPADDEGRADNPFRNGRPQPTSAS